MIIVSPHRQKTLFTTLISSNLIPQPVLSVDLRHQAVGCYTFGSVPSYQYTGAITYTPADGSRGYWMFSPTGYGVGSGNNNTAINSTAAAVAKTKGIADTGTSLIIIDYDVASQYWARSETASFSDELYGWIFDCGEQLPDFTLQIGGPGGFEAVVPGEFLNYDEVDLEDGSNSESLCDFFLFPFPFISFLLSLFFFFPPSLTFLSFLSLSFPFPPFPSFLAFPQ